MTAPFYSNVPYLPEPGLTANDRAIWWALCTFTSKWQWKNGRPVRTEAGSCFPTMKAIAERSGASLATVKRCLRKLEALGHIKHYPQFRVDGGKAANHYVLYAEPLKKAGDD